MDKISVHVKMLVVFDDFHTFSEDCRSAVAMVCTTLDAAASGEMRQTSTLSLPEFGYTCMSRMIKS